MPPANLIGCIILLVIEDAETRRNLMSQLEAKGAEVVAVCGASDALLALRKYQFTASVIGADESDEDLSRLADQFRSKNIVTLVRPCWRDGVEHVQAQLLFLAEQRGSDCSAKLFAPE